MQASLTKLVGLCAAVALVALPLYAHQNDTASLAIRFATESNQFKVGQIVPIELTFNAPTTYEFNTKSYDRSGRMEVDHFDVTPAGRDPLFVYYHDPMSGGWIGGGLSSMLTFDKQPQILERSLNEWVALDKAGHYSLRVTSGRVTGPQDSRERSFVLRSNLLEFDIVDADTQWQRQTLSQAVSALDNPNTSKDDNTQAEQTLRFLDSPESVRELTRQLTKPGGQETWNFMAGLLGARDQELVLKELESRFSEPDAALTSNYLWLVSKMQFARSHAPLPPYPEKDSAKQKDWQDEQAKLFAELDQARDAIYQRAADSLGLKKGAAKASTVATLLVEPRGLDQITRLPAAELTAAFPLLDEKQQSTILNAFSSRVLSPMMASPLEAILDKPKLPGTLRIDALQTLLTVNPQEGRVRILAEIREPHADSLNNSTLLARCLNGLPDKELAEVDDLLIERLERQAGQTRDLDAALIGRYATKAILDKVKTLYGMGSDSWDCAATDGFIRYFLRVDHEYGLRILSTKGSFCTAESLREIAALKRQPDVQPIFIERLYASEPLQARSAMALQSQLIQSLTDTRRWTLTEGESTEVKELTLVAAR